MATSSFWLNFFKDAGIPSKEAKNYAVMFTEHRIRKDMLMDLNKEILNSLGVTLIGDVISIVRHAKEVHSEVIFDICFCVNCSVSNFSQNIILIMKIKIIQTTREKVLEGDSNKLISMRKNEQPKTVKKTEKKLTLSDRLGNNSKTTTKTSISERLGRLVSDNQQKSKMMHN